MKAKQLDELCKDYLDSSVVTKENHKEDFIIRGGLSDSAATRILNGSSKIEDQLKYMIATMMKYMKDNKVTSLKFLRANNTYFKEYTDENNDLAYELKLTGMK